jgi:hypothetical protein
MISPGIVAYLGTQSGVTDLVSTRIYPTVLPQASTLPAITITQIDDMRNGTFAGPDGLPGTLLQLDLWAGTKASANALYEAVRAALDGMTGTAGDENVQSSSIESASDSYEESAKLHRIQVDLRVWWDE